MQDPRHLQFALSTDGMNPFGHMSNSHSVFGSTNDKFCEEFSRIMTKRFEMSMVGELNFFLGFQIKQLK
jgi:hypothetical protein